MRLSAGDKITGHQKACQTTRAATMPHYHEIGEGDHVGKVMRCPFAQCNTRIIECSPGLYATKKAVALGPAMATALGEASGDFYVVGDVWDFDNIGVSRASADLEQPGIDNFKLERLLVCSECDRGPLGFAGFVGDESDVKNLVYYLSTNSVVYE